MNIALAAQDLVEEQSAALDSAERVLMVADSLIKIQTYEIVTARADRGECNSLLAIEKSLTKIQKKKKRKWIAISLGMFVVWIGTEYVEYRLR